MTDELAWETLDSAVEYRCPGFEVIRDAVRLPDGRETAYHYVHDVESVVILPFTTDGEVVLIDEWRQAVGRTNRAFPAGNVEPDDEDLETAARRELGEETGYQADHIESLVTVEPANGIIDAVNHYFVATGCESTGPPDMDHNESIRPLTTSYAALKEAVRTGEIRDGRTVLGLSYFALADIAPPNQGSEGT